MSSLTLTRSNHGVSEGQRSLKHDSSAERGVRTDGNHSTQRRWREPRRRQQSPPRLIRINCWIYPSSILPSFQKPGVAWRRETSPARTRKIIIIIKKKRKHHLRLRRKEKKQFLYIYFLAHLLHLNTSPLEPVRRVIFGECVAAAAGSAGRCACAHPWP